MYFNGVPVVVLATVTLGRYEMQILVLIVYLLTIELASYQDTEGVAFISDVIIIMIYNIS